MVQDCFAINDEGRAFADHVTVNAGIDSAAHEGIAAQGYVGGTGCFFVEEHVARETLDGRVQPDADLGQVRPVWIAEIPSSLDLGIVQPKSGRVVVRFDVGESPAFKVEHNFCVRTNDHAWDGAIDNDTASARHERLRSLIKGHAPR